MWNNNGYFGYQKVGNYDVGVIEKQEENDAMGVSENGIENALNTVTSSGGANAEWVKKTLGAAAADVAAAVRVLNGKTYDNRPLEHTGETPCATSEAPQFVPPTTTTVLPPCEAMITEHANPGDLLIEVTSREGFEVGEVIRLDENRQDYTEVKTIAGFGHKAIILTEPLHVEHLAGTIVKCTQMPPSTYPRTTTPEPTTTPWTTQTPAPTKPPTSGPPATTQKPDYAIPADAKAPFSGETEPPTTSIQVVIVTETVTVIVTVAPETTTPEPTTAKPTTTSTPSPTTTTAIPTTTTAALTTTTAASTETTTTAFSTTTPGTEVEDQEEAGEQVSTPTSTTAASSASSASASSSSAASSSEASASQATTTTAAATTSTTEQAVVMASGYKVGDPTYDGCGNGAPCIFPFSYEGSTYSDCTDVDQTGGEVWCATTLQDDKLEADLWGFCFGEGHGPGQTADSGVEEDTEPA
jgi:hypothetical protein